ncbi:DUF5682 family protein [Brevibacillus laterosporus]|uniref:DUF5682 family protein n=1 Tax=Brevibacillus laterosporus TaxID=1465 RepID=UPI002E1A2A1E|nr:DUF5682 family protein [Brevibacillus laterosporus]
MGRLLQSEEMDQITELCENKIYNLASQVVYFPIRHHSPACSFHLQKTIAAYKPEIILLEGPDNSNHIIEILTHEDTTPPVSIYYAYSKEEHNYTCYFPLLDYSPEYVALKEAKRRGIPAQFIDISYGSRQESMRHGPEDKQESKKISYHDETLLTSSIFIKQLCQKMNCRHFDELWEKVFEVEGIKKSTEDFVKEVYTYCYFSRMCYEEGMLEAEGHLIREAHMKKKILEAQKNFDRILVVTGGFHTYGLLEDRVSNVKIKQVKNEKVYPMVYTFREADHLNGYASGMPFVNYYDTVWRAIQKKQAHPYNKNAVLFLAQLTKSLREKGETASVSDAIEAYHLVQGLATFRSKSEGGAYELLDAVTSAFTKGERSLATSQPLDTLQELMMGNKIGKIAKNDLDVPIVRDFKERGKKYKLHLHTTSKSKKIVDLYAKPLHREISYFFHCLQFLVPEFCQKITGPDWVGNQHIHVVRESWDYSYSSYVEARLIENSIYGGSVKEAAIHKIEECMKELPDHHSRAAAKWLLKSMLMGLEELSDKLFDLVEDFVKKDGSFVSLCQTLQTLAVLSEQKRLFALKETDRLQKLIEETYYHAVTKIYEITKPSPEEINDIVEYLKFLYMLSSKESWGLSIDIFKDQLVSLLAVSDILPRFEGVIIAILCNLDVLDREEIALKARSYMFGTPENMLHTAAYLQGIFTIARDVFLHDKQLLEDLNKLIGRLSYEDFLQIVPELRLAFTYFTPMEIMLISEKVASIFQTTAEDLQSPVIEERLLQQVRKMDQAIEKEFAKWNLI